MLSDIFRREAGAAIGVGRRGWPPRGPMRRPEGAAGGRGRDICMSTHETCPCGACRTPGTSKGPCHGRKIFRDGVMTVSQVSDEPHLASKSRGDWAARNGEVGGVPVFEGNSVVGWSSLRLWSIRGLQGLARAEWLWASGRISRVRAGSRGLKDRQARRASTHQADAARKVAEQGRLGGSPHKLRVASASIPFLASEPETSPLLEKVRTG